jgi:hypothetical protein
LLHRHTLRRVLGDVPQPQAAAVALTQLSDTLGGLGARNAGTSDDDDYAPFALSGPAQTLLDQPTKGGGVTLLRADALEDYRGLFWQRPWLAALLTAMLLSFAGIPLTAGFVGKFYVLTAGVTSALWGLVILLVINSAIGLFYYLRIVVVMYTPSVGAEPRRAILTPWLASVAGVWCWPPLQS